MIETIIYILAGFGVWLLIGFVGAFLNVLATESPREWLKGVGVAVLAAGGGPIVLYWAVSALVRQRAEAAYLALKEEEDEN
jgi:hypothetical protein